MVNINELSAPSNSLKAADLEGAELELTIESYVVREFDQTDEKTGEQYKQKKPIFSFKGTDKTLVCNNTNREAIAYAYGPEMDDWVGKPITLYPTVVPFGHKNVEAIRVRVTKKATAKPKFLKDGAKPYDKEKYDERNPPPNDDIPF
jgi:hypothetical protein